MNTFLKKLSRYREIVLGVLDTVLVCLAYFLAYYIRMDYGNLYTAETFHAVFGNLPWIVIINMAFLLIFKVNKTLWQYVSIDEVVRVMVSIVCSNALWLILIILMPVKSFPRSVPVIAAMLQALLMLGARILYRLYRRNAMQSKRTHRAVIIGAGSAGALTLRDLTMSDRYDAKVIGFIDDNKSKQGKIISGIQVIGTTDDLAVIKDKFDIDVVYIAIKNISKQDLKEIIEKCRKVNLATKIISFEMLDGEKGVAQVRDVSIDDLLGRGEIKLDSTGINNYLSGKVVMITGGGGSIGSELARQILKFKPATLVLVDIYENNMYDLQQEIKIGQKHGLIDKSIQVICLIGSVRDKDRIDTIMKTYHPSVLFHAAAHKHVPLVEDSPMEAIKNNVFGTFNTIQCCIENHVDKFVLISTDKAVNPTNVMGATKRMCEIIVQGYRNNGVTELCAVRFGNVLGSSGSVIPLFKKQIAAGGPVTVTDPNIVRYFMTIPEAAQLVLQAGVYAHNGEIFVLDMGSPVKIADLAENLIRLSGFEPGVDIQIEYTGLRPGEKMYEELALEKENRTKTENDMIYINEPSDFTEQDVKDKLAVLSQTLKDHGDYKKTIMEAIH